MIQLKNTLTRCSTTSEGGNIDSGRVDCCGWMLDEGDDKGMMDTFVVGDGDGNEPDDEDRS